jgi:glutamine synthetase
MSQSASDIIQHLKSEEVLFVDLRFTDTYGIDQHVTLPMHAVDADFFADGKAFDGSSIAGWKDIHESDMLLKPIVEKPLIDPFFEAKTAIIRCAVYDPFTQKLYDRAPRSIAHKAEDYLKSTGIADVAFFGPEFEFFVFDSVRWKNQMQTVSYDIDSSEGAWNSGMEHPNLGHRPRVKGGYFPLPPVDSGQDFRSELCMMLDALGITTELHHHEVATAGQFEIGAKFNSLLKKADESMILKYVVRALAHSYGQTATFMPKPLLGDNGSGMHCHQSLSKAGKNIFMGDVYAGLSQDALYYIGGILKHAPAINAFTNSTTNSYKRLVPGFEAPEMLAYSSCNRSAAIRIPYVASQKAARIEVRFPDPVSNPYLAFSAMLMAGLDGIQNKIDPGKPAQGDLYHLSKEERKKIPTVSSSLEMALENLDKDREFLKKGAVFSDDMIDTYIELKMAEVTRLRMSPHPVEFEQYYSL